MSFFIALKFLFLMLSFISRTLCLAIIHLSTCWEDRKRNVLVTKEGKRVKIADMFGNDDNLHPDVPYKLSWRRSRINHGIPNIFAVSRYKGNVIAIPTRNHVDKRRGKNSVGSGLFNFTFFCQRSKRDDAQYKNDLFYIMNKEVTMVGIHRPTLRSWK